MSAANKAKGSRYESEVCEALQAAGVRAKRLPRTGVNDIGDAAFPLREIGTVVLEIKNRREINLSQFVAEALVESVNYERKYPAEAPAFGAAVVKRRQKGVMESYVVMQLDEFIDLLREGRAL